MPKSARSWLLNHGGTILFFGTIALMAYKEFVLDVAP